ncbi:VTT domain-containing protein [Nocardioides zeae]|uniref:VTT domain-containing protein n=1 Tax=Nocardioides imazamoxiresistens TaxID=3231893 RepID=A0ABU3PTU9_9ACTN|nr:VTT domain-containing protein [Nocardioides zeae]MDT9592643.1 VTT domain-containing protein [Nocardioides zeae]
MDTLLDLARSLLGSPWLYAVVLLLVMADCFLPAVPSDEVIIAVAALAMTEGEPGVLVGLLAVGACGALVGDSTGFWIGRRLPRERLKRYPRLARMLGAADRQFVRRGARIVVTARFLPVIRIGVNLVAGGAMRYRSWVPLAALACLLWASFTVTIGAVAGFGLSDQPLLAMAIGMGIGVTAGFVLDRVLTARAKRAEEQPAG